MVPLNQQTPRYRTYIKETLTQALRDVFADHPDSLMRKTEITPELPLSRAQFPSIIIRYYERYIRNAGVGHSEWIKITDESTEPAIYQRFKHFLYGGDLEFYIIALSSKDRDWLADAVVQVISMADTENYSDAFLQRIYNPDQDAHPGSKLHFINLKTDEFSGYGDQDGLAPWMTDDVLAYRTSYRVPIFGEFYSRQLTSSDGYGLVTKVELYPWSPPEPEPNPNPEDPAQWLNLDNFQVG